MPMMLVDGSSVTGGGALRVKVRVERSLLVGGFWGHYAEDASIAPKHPLVLRCQASFKVPEVFIASWREPK